LTYLSPSLLSMLKEEGNERIIEGTQRIDLPVDVVWVVVELSVVTGLIRTLMRTIGSTMHVASTRAKASMNATARGHVEHPQQPLADDFPLHLERIDPFASGKLFPGDSDHR
jgi:hypothetical protein